MGTNGFTPEEWRTAARIARRSIFTEGNPDLADAWEKAADQAKARLIPAGGMALTAEQVEDVRKVLGKATTEYGAMELTAAWARLRALFPATEPAEAKGGTIINGLIDCHEIYTLTAEEFADLHNMIWEGRGDYSSRDRLREKFPIDMPGVDAPTKPKLTECCGTLGEIPDPECPECGINCATPAPAELAEEEAKAEYPHRGLGDLTVLGPEIFTNGDVINWRGENFVRQQDEGICSAKFDGDRVYRCALADGHYGDHTTAQGEHWQKRPSSSPVVPAPTETGPWQTWQEVPEGVKYSPKARPPAGSPLRLLAQPLWVNRGGTRYQARSGTVSKIGDVEMFHYAPFVAAEEG